MIVSWNTNVGGFAGAHVYWWPGQILPGTQYIASPIALPVAPSSGGGIPALGIIEPCPFDISDDFALLLDNRFDPIGDFENVATCLSRVIYRNRNRGREAIVSRALRRSVTSRELDPSEGRLVSMDVIWHLPIPTVGILRQAPDLGGTIHDGDEEWTILNAVKETLSTRWRLTCRNLSLVFDLSEAFRIERSYTKRGEAAEAVPVYRTVATGVPGRFQPDAGTIETAQDARVLRQTGSLFLGHHYDIDARTRLVGPDGAHYGVNRVTRMERLGEPLTLDVERTWRDADAN